MVEPLLLHDLLRTAAGRTPNRPAYSMGQTVRTFAEVLAEAEHLAGVLQRRGIGKGDRVVWWADTSLHAGPLYYGLAHLGATFVPLNPRFSTGEAEAVCDTAEPALRIADDHHAGDVAIDELLAERPPSTIDLPVVDETDPDVIFFTSGTTGKPKGVVLSHRANRLRVTSVSPSPVGPTLTMFPQFHWGGWSFVHGNWASCEEHCLTPATDAHTLMEVIHRRRVATFYAIPGIWRRILAADRSAYDLTSLRSVNTGTSSTPPELLAAIAEAFPGTTTSIGYGATEAGGLATLAPQDLWRKPGSVGMPAPGFHVRFEDGELWVKGPQMSSGYFRNDEANAAAFVDGWYRTGDLVERDTDGYLYVVGRIKDVIRTAGEYVAPPEVDVVLMRHPAVADAAVAGVPHLDWGEVVAAFVVLKPGAELDLAELRRHCEGELAAYKHPRELHIVDAIPRTGPTGQVQRRHLTEIAVDRALGAG